MEITSYSRDQINRGLSKVREEHTEPNDQIRVLFPPTVIDDKNFERVCDIYGRIDPTNYDTVVVVEIYDEKLDKKLPMPSHSYFETSLGKVEVNDYLRNEFCDEEDDFFIHDEGYSKNMSLFHQLMMLQCAFDEFKVLSVQIADREQAIVKELTHVLQEVLASRQALLVFCCDLDHHRQEEFEKVQSFISAENESGLLNYLNSGESRITGSTVFIAGILVGKKWELKHNFLNGGYKDYSGSLLTGYAERQRVIF